MAKSCNEIFLSNQKNESLDKILRGKQEVDQVAATVVNDTDQSFSGGLDNCNHQICARSTAVQRFKAFYQSYNTTVTTAY